MPELRPDGKDWQTEEASPVYVPLWDHANHRHTLLPKDTACVRAPDDFDAGSPDAEVFEEGTTARVQYSGAGDDEPDRRRATLPLSQLGEQPIGAFVLVPTWLTRWLLYEIKVPTGATLGGSDA